MVNNNWQSTATTALITASACALVGYLHCRWNRAAKEKPTASGVDQFLEVCRQARYMMQLPFVHSAVLLENHNAFQFSALKLDYSTSVVLTVDRSNTAIIVVKGGDARRFSYLENRLPWSEIEAWILSNDDASEEVGTQTSIDSEPPTLKLPILSLPLD